MDLDGEVHRVALGGPQDVDDLAQRQVTVAKGAEVEAAGAVEAVGVRETGRRAEVLQVGADHAIQHRTQRRHRAIADDGEVAAVVANAQVRRVDFQDREHVLEKNVAVILDGDHHAVRFGETDRIGQRIPRHAGALGRGLAAVADRSTEKGSQHRRTQPLGRGQPRRKLVARDAEAAQLDVQPVLGSVVAKPVDVGGGVEVGRIDVQTVAAEFPALIAVPPQVARLGGGEPVLAQVQMIAERVDGELHASLHWMRALMISPRPIASMVSTYRPTSGAMRREIIGSGSSSPRL